MGWFLHTPFPSSEIYRTLPVREEVLRAVLKADLIGFHTYDYARHFVSACTRILGLEVGALSSPVCLRNCLLWRRSQLTQHAASAVMHAAVILAHAHVNFWHSAGTDAGPCLR